ncbi:MAG: M90 family metallopeptidase [Gemmatimonadota bacterium]
MTLGRLRGWAAENWALGAFVPVLALLGFDVVRRWAAMWEWHGLAAVTVTLVTIGGGVLLGHHLLGRIRWNVRVRLPGRPPPATWREIVESNVPLATRLTPETFERLLGLMQVFLRKKRFEGAGGLDITEEIRVTIAAHACLLLLHLEVGVYPGLHTIIVYPAAFETGRNARKGRGRVATLGESWSNGVVVLSWDSVLHGAFDPKDGRNVAIHEFAHQLDQADGEADGTPIGLRPTTVAVWADVIDRRYRLLRRAKRKGRRTVMNHYGATNRAEFFAVATEAFFEKPRQLEKKKTDLYQALVGFYGWDPIEELRRRGSDGARPTTEGAS